MGFYFRLFLTDAMSNITETPSLGDFLPKIHKNLQLYGLSNIFQYVSWTEVTNTVSTAAGTECVASPTSSQAKSLSHHSLGLASE